MIVGSKAFTESVILGEIAAQSSGGTHTRAMGGTRVLYDALLAGQIDAYPEYTGTLTQEILHGQPLPPGIAATASLGFDDTYAIGVLRADLHRLSDLAGMDLTLSLRDGLGNEISFVDNSPRASASA